MSDTRPENPPTPTDPTTQNQDLCLRVRMLYDEQERLRAEVDSLRDKQTQDEGDGEGRGGEEGKKDQVNEGSQGQQKQNDKERKKKPALERFQTWIKEHPMRAVLIVVGLVVLGLAVFLLWEYISSYKNTNLAFVDGHTGSHWHKRQLPIRETHEYWKPGDSGMRGTMADISGVTPKPDAAKRS